MTKLTEEQKRKLAFMLHKFQNGNVADDIYIGYEEIADFIEQLLTEAEQKAVERCIEICKKYIGGRDTSTGDLEDIINIECLEELRQLSQEDKLKQEKGE